MKRFLCFSLIAIIFLPGKFIISQGTIWAEDFSTYVDDTGITGPGVTNSGDYPANVTKWTLDVSGCTLSNDLDYIKTDVQKLKIQDVDGDAIWQSEVIDMSVYSNGGSFSIKFYEYDSMEEDDYIDVYYQLDGGSFTLIENWNNHGSSTHTLVGDFSKDTVVRIFPQCSTLVIKVAFNNDSGYEELQMDDVFVYANMNYSSATTIQNTLKIAAGQINRQIICLEVVTEHDGNPLSITQISVNANGSSTPVSQNIENAKIFYTGNTNNFSDVNQFGTTVNTPSTSDFSITGSQTLMSGSNYFWLTFDTKPGAFIGQLVDAEYVSFVIDGVTYIPTITAPAGNRMISGPLSGTYTIGTSGDYSGFTQAVNELNELGISSTTVFDVQAGTYTEQISIGEISGTSSADTVVVKSVTGNAGDVCLQYSPSSSNNYITEINSSSYLTIKDMTLTNTGSGTNGCVIRLTGNSGNININNCILNGINTSSESTDLAVIYGEGGSTNQISNLLISNDTLNYGSYGIYLAGESQTSPENGNQITGNSINNFNYSGIEVNYQNAVIIMDNNICGSGINTYEQGIYANCCDNYIQIRRNRVLLSSATQNFGIYLQNCYGFSGQTGLITNNFVSLEEGTFGAIGVYLYSSGYQHLIYNSIYTHSSGKTSGRSRSLEKKGFKIHHQVVNAMNAGIEIYKNMIFGNLVGIDFSQITADNGYVEKSDDNNIATDGDIFGEYGDQQCADIGEWQTESGMDENSTSENPFFITFDSPEISNENLNGAIPADTIVHVDIDKSPRRDNTTAGCKNFVNVWTGSVSSDWNNPSNWSKNAVPSTDDDILIYPNAVNQPDLTTDANCRDLLLKAGSLLNANNFDLNIYGNADISQSEIQNQNKISIKGNETTELASGNNSISYLEIDKNNIDDTLKLRKLDNNISLKVIDFDGKNGTVDVQNGKVELSGSGDFSGTTLVNLGDTEFTSSQVVNFNPGSNTFQKLSFTGDGTYNQLAKLICQGDFLATGVYNDNDYDIDFYNNFDVKEIREKRGNGYYYSKGDNNRDIFMCAATRLALRMVNITHKGKTVNIYPAVAGQLLTLISLEFISGVMKSLSSDSNFVVIHSSLECDTLIIGTESIDRSIIQIAPECGITVNHKFEITDNGSVVLKSDDSGTGSLISNVAVTGNGINNVSVERYLEDSQWHLISSPVSGATANNLYFNGSPDVWLKTHNEADDSWTYITDLSTPMPFGQGMATWVGSSKSNVTATFEGGINTEDITLNNSSSPSLQFTDIDHGYNLVGNPYPSAVDWDSGSWSRTNIEGTVWVWHDAGLGDGSGNYLVRNLAGEGSLTDGIIPVNQGFFIRATSSSPSLTIPADARIHSSQQFYKSGKREESPHIILSVGNSVVSDQVWIGFDDESTFDFDDGRDAHKLFGTGIAPQLYVTEEDQNLSINISPELTNEEQRKVYCALKPGSSGDFTLTAIDIESIPGYDVFLEDRKTGNIHNLIENPVYEFHADQADNPDRFIIHFNLLSTEINESAVNEDNTRIFSTNSMVYISRDITNNYYSNVYVYDISGRMIAQKQLQNNSMEKITVNSTNQLVIVVLKGEKVKIQKVMVQ